MWKYPKNISFYIVSKIRKNCQNWKYDFQPHQTIFWEFFLWNEWSIWYIFGGSLTTVLLLTYDGWESRHMTDSNKHHRNLAPFSYNISVFGILLKYWIRRFPHLKEISGLQAVSPVSKSLRITKYIYIYIYRVRRQTSRPFWEPLYPKICPEIPSSMVSNESSSSLLSGDVPGYEIWT